MSDNLLCLHRTLLYRGGDSETCLDCGEVRLLPQGDGAWFINEPWKNRQPLRRDPPGTADPDARRIPKVPKYG